MASSESIVVQCLVENQATFWAAWSRIYMALSSHVEMCLFRSWAKPARAGHLCQVWRILGLLLHLGLSLLLEEEVVGWKCHIRGAEKTDLVYKMPAKARCSWEVRNTLLVWLFGLGGCSVGQFGAGCVWYASAVGQESSAGRGGCCCPRAVSLCRGREGQGAASNSPEGLTCPTWMPGTRELFKDMHLTICVICLVNFLYLTSYFAPIF